MKVWLDAHREPEVDWVWSRTVQGAIIMLRGGCVERISFAPDQRRDLINPVVDWMIEHGSAARRSVHRPDGGVRRPRGFLQLKRPLP